MYSQGDILLVPIPFTDLSSSKKRPVIVVSNDAYNADHTDVVVVALTSNLSFENQYSVNIDSRDLLSGRLEQQSRVRCDKIYTLSANIVLKKFAEIKQETLAKIRERIHHLIKSSE